MGEIVGQKDHYGQISELVGSSAFGGAADGAKLLGDITDFEDKRRSELVENNPALRLCFVEADTLLRRMVHVGSGDAILPAPEMFIDLTYFSWNQLNGG